MKNKKGFISISIVYSFFIIFMLLLLLIMSSYVNTRLQSTVYKNDIKMKSTSKKNEQFNNYLVNRASSGNKFYNDGKGNYRFQGNNVKNYVTFNGEKWRVIGVFNQDSHGKSLKLVKIVRNDKLTGTIRYDFKKGTPDDTVGSSDQANGSNNWSDSQLMMLLNFNRYRNTGMNKDNKAIHNYLIGGGYVYNITTKFDNNENLNENYRVNLFRNMGSYFERSNLDVYYPAEANITSGYTNSNKINNFNKKISKIAEDQIEEVTWHTGAINNISQTGNFYANERGDVVPDELLRSITWTGMVGLIYPSDFTLASRNNQNWMNYIKNAWTMSYVRNSKNRVINTNNNGNGITSSFANTALNVYPVVYLKADVKVVSGSGTSSDPFIISR